MLYREIVAVCSEIHKEHTNTVCGQNVVLLNVTLVVQIVTTGLYTLNQSSVTHYAAQCQCYTFCPLVLPHSHLHTCTPKYRTAVPVPSPLTPEHLHTCTPQYRTSVPVHSSCLSSLSVATTLCTGRSSVQCPTKESHSFFLRVL